MTIKAVLATALRAATSAVPLIIVGCGDGASSTSSSPPRADLPQVAACEILTAEEIERATGVAPREGQDVSQAGGRVPMCNWPVADANSSAIIVNLMVTVTAYDSYAEFVEYAQDEGLFSPEDLEEVQGVGDFGVWMRDLRMLQVHDGDRMVQILVGPTATAEPLAAARALGEAALSRIR